MIKKLLRSILLALENL